MIKSLKEILSDYVKEIEQKRKEYKLKQSK